MLYIDGVPLAQTKAILRRMCVRTLVERDKIWRNLLQVAILSGGFCIASTKIWDIVRSVAKDRKVCQYYIYPKVWSYLCHLLQLLGCNQSKSLISKYCMYISIYVVLPPTDHLISYETMQEMPRRHLIIVF